MNCVRTDIKEFQELLETTKLPSLLLEMRIAKWQEQNGLDRFPTSDEVLVRTDVVELFESNPELANEVYEALWGNSSISKIIEEEISIYNRFKGSNYFKDNPSDMFSPNFMRESVEEINPNEVILTEQGQSEERLREMGEYKIPEYGEYSTEYPIAFKYNDKIYLLDGHHRITLAKRSNIDKVKIAVKNIKFDFVNKLSPQQKQQAQQLYSQYLEQNPNGSVEQFKSWFNNNQSDIQYQKQIDLQAEQDTVLEEFANNLSERFNIPFDLVSEEDARAMFPEYTNEPAFFDPKTKKAYLVKGKANKTSAIHEIFTHPFLLQIEKTNPTLYKNLLKEAKDNKSVVDYVDNLYGTNQNNDHEYIARAIDLAVQGELDQQKDKTLLERIQDFFNQLSDYLKKLFNIPEVFSSAISPNITLQQLTQFAMYGKGKMNLNPAQENIEYSLKATNVIVKNLDKIKQWEKNKSISGDVLWNKIQGLGVPKEQLELIKNSEGNTVEEKLLDFANQYGYTIEINTAIATHSIDPEESDFYTDNGIISQEKGQPTQYYSNLTVPGGTNYTENEIATPAITPSIKGHAQFATDNGIGWFRSDDKTITEKSVNKAAMDAFGLEDENESSILKQAGVSKTRRILEAQSDLFQKGRTRQLLTNDRDLESAEKEGAISGKEAMQWAEQLEKTTENQFLQLLNKNNNWVTFFIKAIIQDSAKKGYEKVLFPKGNTAAKIEGHTTLEEFKKQIEDRIKQISGKLIVKKNESDERGVWDIIDENNGLLIGNQFSEKAALDRIPELTKNREIEINQLKQELERVETEGFGALKPIYNFYENTVTNILKKQGYNPVEITDEYGNTWNEVTIDENRDNQNIVFQKTPQSNSFQQFQQSLNKPNTNSVLQGNQEEQVKKFNELQERLNNKEFLEGAKNAFESSEELQNVYYESTGVNQELNLQDTWINYVIKKDNISKEEVLQRLETHKPKMITVYRGEGSTVNLENSNLPEYVKKSKGRWFTKDKEVAKQYAEAQKGSLYALQIPETLFNNISKELNLENTNGVEALLPQELVNEKVKLSYEITPQQKQDALNAYTDYIARVSLGIIKNPTSGEYNYESKVKDIVYRGEGNNDSNKYLYFTNNKKEAYLYSKNHITKGGNINERNPTISINKNFSKYLESKYSKILIKSLYHEPLGPGDFFEGFIENPKSKLSEEDLILFNKIERFNILYDYVKIEDENDLTKPYDDDYYINNIDEYNSLKKELDNYYNKKDIGNLISAIINITNPYIDEITQEDLINNRLAFKNGKDGAFLLGGDHFLVKKDQIHILGSKDDIEGFRNWVGNSQSSGSLHIDFSFFQKSPSEQEEYLTNMFENLQEEEVVESVEVEDVIDSIFQGSLSEVIDNMIHHMDLSDNTSEILLKILSKTNAEIEYVSASELTSTDTIMEYDHGRNVIKVSLERLKEYSPAEISITLLHEMVHSITVESLRNPKTFEQKDLVDLIESFINDNKDLSEEWGMSSTFEFVAELYSNPEFRDKVKEASKTKWWSDFINAIRRLLGLPYKRNYNNLVERVIEFVDNAESSETTFNQIFERKSTEKESKYANLTSYLNIVYEEIQDKVGQVADRIRASQKFKSQEDKKEYLENIEKLIEFLEEHHETGQWLGVLEYTKLFLKTTQQVNNLLEKITPQDIENGDLGALLHRYEEYLAAYDLLEDMKGLLDFANRKSDELSEKELEDVKEIGDFLRSARIVKEGIDSKILHIKKRQLVKFYSNPLYNTQVTTNWRILLSNEYRDLPEEEREKISEVEYISQKLNGEYKQDYEADLKKSAEKLVYDPLIDISWTARHLYDPFNTNQPIIQILTNFIGEIRQRIVERSREKNFTIDELHKKLIKEKGNKKPSALFKNLYQQDKDGNYFLKGEYDITFYDAYREEYLPILQSIQEIYKLFGNKLSEETTAELNKLRIKKSTWEKKYLKEDKLTPKDEFKTDLSALSPAERQILEEFINITKGSHDKTEGRVSLIRNVSFKRGKKRNDIEFFKLPAINKTDIERRIEADAKGIIKDKTEDLFTIRTDDVGYAKEAITAKGRPVAEIPIYFRGNLDPSQQSLDLASMYKMEFWNGEQFKESTQGKYTAHMILDVVGSNDFLKKSRGVPRLLQNAFAKRQPNQKVEGTSTNTYHRIQGLIERNFGGITTYYAGKFLGKDVNKMISNVQAMTGVLGMSFNAAAGVANLFNGFSNLIMEAVGNNIVGRKHLMKAESKYMLALANGEILSDLTNPVKKSFINQLNEYFDVFGGLMPEQQSSLRNNFMRKFASLGMLNWMNDSGEHMLHSILNMAILDSIKVMNKDGKYINKQGEVVSEENAASLLDMFYLDKNGHLAVHEAVGKTKYNLTIDFQEGGKVHIKNLIKKKIFDIYGVYDTNFKNELSKLWGGKLLMTFKNFFLSLFNYRFAGIEYSHLPLEEREDWQKFYSTADQEYIEGIYTTFVHTVVIPIFKGFKIALIKENYNKLTDYQKSNLRKALFEFAMTNVLLPAIGLLLAAIDGDDDDKLWFAIYINRRLTAELAQFRNPVEATKLLTNPIASAKFVRDAIGLSLEIIRPWRWDERAGDGELRIRKRFKRVVPIWNQLEKNYRQLYNIQFNN